MTLKIPTILFLLTAFNLAIGQTPQSSEDINSCKQLKLKSVRVATIFYSDNASAPEGQILYKDTSTSLQLFDTSGRLVKEYAGSGTNYFRNIYYDYNGRIDHEIWFFSSLQIYPKSLKPKADSDYDRIYKKVKYYFNTRGKVDSSVNERGSKTVYQYNDSGYLVSTLEIEPSGFVENFQITKYGYGINWGKILYKVSNHSTNTVTYEYEYRDRKLLKRKIIYDNGNKSTTYYDNNDQELVEDLFDKDDKQIAKFEYKYNRYGLERIISYRLPVYNSGTEPRIDKLRLSEEEIYKYDTY